jgi:DNA modification methylase
LKEVLHLNNEFDCLFDRPIFNFEDIKLEGEPYKITRKAQRLYGVKSNFGEYTQVNNGKRNPKTVLEYPIIQGGKEYFGHPTQKPEALIKYLITSCSNEGDIIFDPFMGSGTTAVASRDLNRNWISFDTDPEYVKISQKRIGQIPQQNSIKRVGMHKAHKKPKTGNKCLMSYL